MNGLHIIACNVIMFALSCVIIFISQTQINCQSQRETREDLKTGSHLVCMINKGKSFQGYGLLMAQPLNLLCVFWKDQQ